MGRDPLLICREYLRSSSSKTRRKAVVALEVNGGAAELARLALSDQDEAVRRRAGSAITRLDPEARAQALALLDEALGKDDQGLVAHALLTRLRNQGVALPGSRRSLLCCLGLALTVRRDAAHSFDPKFWTRAYPWCLGFALLGVLMVSFLIALNTTPATLPLPLTLTAIVLLLSPLLARAACTGAQPGDRYLDRLSGWLAEILGSGFAALPVFAVGAVLLLLLWPPIRETPGTTVMLLGLGMLGWGWLFIAVIRAVTLSSAVLFRRSRWSTLLGATAGWGAGIAAASALLYLVDRFGAREHENLVTLAAVCWLLALPLAAGVAAVFARLERDTAPPKRWRWRIFSALPCILGWVLLLTSWIWLFEQQTTAPIRCEPAVLEAPAQCDSTFERLPALLPFQVKFWQKASILKPRQGATDLALRLWQGDQQILPEADQPLIEIELAAGSYLLEVVDYSSLKARARTPRFRHLIDRFFDVARQLAGLARDDSYDLWARDVKPFDLKITLNSDPMAAVSAKILDDLATGKVEDAFKMYNDNPDLHSSAKLLDQLCRITSLQGLLKLQGQRSDLLAVCDRAVELTGGNGAIHDSRGLAKVLLGKPIEAKEDFEIFANWTADSWEMEQRQQWIKALSGPARDPREALPVEHLTALLSKSLSRDFASLTHSSAQAHVARGAAALTSGLCQSPQEPTTAAVESSTTEPPNSERSDPLPDAPLPVAFEQARAAFELASTMVPALKNDAAFWLFLCKRGVLLQRSSTVAVATACEALPGAPTWIEEMRATLALPRPELLKLRQAACDDLSVPTVPAVDFGANTEGSSERPAP